MTENFLQKLEEKVMVLLTELETLRKDHHTLRQENSNLKADKLNYTKKMQGLLSLLESLEVAENSNNTFELQNLKEEELATA